MEDSCKSQTFKNIYIVFSALEKLSPRIIPIVWFNETASFDPATRDQLLGVAHLRSRTFVGGIVFYLLFGSALIGIVALVIMQHLRRQVGYLFVFTF